MRLVHPVFSSPMVISEKKVSVLTVEAPELFRNFLLDINGQLAGESGDFVLSEDYCPIAIAKSVCLISDPLHPDFSSRRLQSAVLQMLAANAEREDFFLKTQEIRSVLAKYILELTQSIDVPLAFQEEPEIPALLKALNVRPSGEDLSVPEALCAYMDLLSEMRAAKPFVFVHLKSYLTTEELKAMYVDFRYRKYRVLLLESHDDVELRDWENTLLIDKDMCEVINQNI